MKLLITILICLLFQSCSNKTSNEVIHPTPINTTSDKQFAITDLILQQKSGETFKLDYDYKEVAHIGKKYGKDEEMFGTISDIEKDTLNRLYILDERQQLIQVYDIEGNFLSTIGRKGAGPGEFEGARSLSIYKNLLLVSNGYRIEVFNIESEEIKFLKTVQFDKRIHSICTSGDNLFIHNTQLLNQDDKVEGEDYVNMLHSYKLPDFTFQFSFGQSYISKTPMVVDRMSLGNINCNNTGSIVVFAFERVPTIHGYSIDNGDLKWTTNLKGINNFQVIETKIDGKPRLTYKQSENNISDQILPLNRFQANTLFQIHRRIFSEPGKIDSNKFIALKLDASSGVVETFKYDLSGYTFFFNRYAAQISEDYTTIKILQKNSID